MSAPSIEDARRMGATGGPAVEAERLAFEAWMAGHCWALCATWTGTQYRSDDEASGDVNPHAMRTRQLWAAWRDRAALAAPAVPPEGCTPADAAMLRRANHGLADEVHMLQRALADLHRQVQEFVTTNGEADFYTGAALAVLAKTAPLEYRWPHSSPTQDEVIAKLLAAAPTAQQEPGQ